MGYEIFARKISRTGTPNISLNTFGRIGFNQAATSILQKNAVEFVLVLWDDENRRLAIRPITRKDSRAYRVGYSKKGNGSGFSAKTFMDHIEFDYSETHSLPILWSESDGMFEAEIPVELLKGQRQQKLLSVEPTKKGRTGKTG